MSTTNTTSMSESYMSHAIQSAMEGESAWLAGTSPPGWTVRERILPSALAAVSEGRVSSTRQTVCRQIMPSRLN
jgi:hypothetical protein